MLKKVNNYIKNESNKIEKISYKQSETPNLLSELNKFIESSKQKYDFITIDIFRLIKNNVKSDTVNSNSPYSPYSPYSPNSICQVLKNIINILADNGTLLIKIPDLIEVGESE